MEKEKLVIIITTEHLKHYLGDKMFIIEIDHKHLMYFDIQNNLSK